MNVYLFDENSGDPGFGIYANIVRGGVKREICNICNKPHDTSIVHKLEINLFGEQLHDFVWSDSDKIIITKKINEMFALNGIKGYKEYEVIVEYLNDEDTIVCDKFDCLLS